MIFIYQRTLKQKSVKEVPEIKPGVWVHAVAPTPEEITSLSTSYSFEEGLLEDATDIYEVPRLEVEEGISYFFTRVPSKGRHDMATVPFTIAVHPEFVLTLAPENLSVVTTLSKDLSITATTQKVKFLILILSKISNLYFESINSIRREVNKIKVSPQNVTDKEILRFIELESDVNEYLTALISMNDMYKRLANGSVLKLYEEDEDLVKDLELGVEQLIDGAKTILRTIVNIREAYSVVATNRLNRVIQTLTILTVLLTIPTMVTSFFGMNVDLPLERNDNAAAIILLVTLALVGIVVAFLKKNKWL